MRNILLIILVLHLLLFCACGKVKTMESVTAEPELPAQISDSVPELNVSIDETQSGSEMPEPNEGEKSMTTYDFSVFPNVNLIHADLSSMTEEQQAVLYQQARYCQAMTEADIDTMRALVSEDMTYTHMSGMQQTREEYFADVADGSLTYYSIGMDRPVVEVNGDRASVTYTAVLNANAYGARGTFRMKGTHWYENRDGVWIAVNRPD